MQPWARSGARAAPSTPRPLPAQAGQRAHLFLGEPAGFQGHLREVSWLPGPPRSSPASTPIQHAAWSQEPCSHFQSRRPQVHCGCVQHRPQQEGIWLVCSEMSSAGPLLPGAGSSLLCCPLRSHLWSPLCHLQGMWPQYHFQWLAPTGAACPLQPAATQSPAGWVHSQAREHHLSKATALGGLKSGPGIPLEVPGLYVPLPHRGPSAGPTPHGSLVGSRHGPQRRRRLASFGASGAFFRMTVGG